MTLNFKKCLVITTTKLNRKDGSRTKRIFDGSSRHPR